MAILNNKSFHKACNKRAPYIDLPCEELGGDLRLGRLTADMGIKLGKHWNALPKTADGKPADEAALVEYYVVLLAMAAVDEEGNRYLLNDEGKAQLRLLTFNSIATLGVAALDFLGLSGDDKKKPTKKAGTSKTPSTP